MKSRTWSHICSPAAISTTRCFTELRSQCPAEHCTRKNWELPASGAMKVNEAPAGLVLSSGTGRPSLIQRHAATDVSGHIQVFASMDRRLALVEPAFRHNLEGQLSLAHLGRVSACGSADLGLLREQLLDLLRRQRRRGRQKTRTRLGWRARAQQLRAQLLGLPAGRRLALAFTIADQRHRQFIGQSLIDTGAHHELNRATLCFDLLNDSIDL